ncbi:protein-glutamate methylesterase/protein-glutamine glutaminase [aff. Roholtiella sp. LEGE 12411]|uniref:protein-glutamate methylesterase/protein-glutamine glutaminase n=1 Tax=aff. Roholtiella sp. LEGE 12411 TaxID=1828822 RepID=UPI00187F4472|nr:chemotaxis response regulator protein-glutamate methylesterase [aff. Roholtiella sp. LEGE 12411]MBE9036232.1 chemotaxis response regulator protein-glutamate methylesterase [aff. Roholtiella sp. LEGE 12411]
MSKIHILIVDDAVIVRSRLSKLFALDSEFEVVGVAATGRIAIAKIPQVNPDVVILDVEMPDMNGLETLAEIRRSYPNLPVIMFSTQTHTGAAATLDALALGASDYATKPSQLGSVEAANQHIQETLFPKIKFFGAKTARPSASVPVAAPAIHSSQRIRSSLALIDILAIGASTGGPNALSLVLPQLPKTFPIPIVIVQHMPAMFTRLMAERLATKCQLAVAEAYAGAPLTPGTIWIAPGDYHVEVTRSRTQMQLITHQATPENFCRPSVDVLFRSIAQHYKARSLGVILTGMGQDGLRGCESMRGAGGRILVQDEASSVVWGMPGFVANAGLADAVLPLDVMAIEILHQVAQASSGMDQERQ